MAYRDSTLEKLQDDVEKIRDHISDLKEGVARHDERLLSIIKVLEDHGDSATKIELESLSKRVTKLYGITLAGVASLAALDKSGVIKSFIAILLQ